MLPQEENAMQLSARNRLKGSVVDVRKDSVAAQLSLSLTTFVEKVRHGPLSALVNVISRPVAAGTAATLRCDDQRLAFGKNSCWPSSL